MALGEVMHEAIAFGFTAGWDPDARIQHVEFGASPGRRVVELSSRLDSLGVHTATFSYQGETTLVGQAAYEAAVAPLVARMLEGLRR
jgi:hypothetical protein